MRLSIQLPCLVIGQKSVPTVSQIPRWGIHPPRSLSPPYRSYQGLARTYKDTHSDSVKTTNRCLLCGIFRGIFCKQDFFIKENDGEDRVKTSYLPSIFFEAGHCKPMECNRGIIRDVSLFSANGNLLLWCLNSGQVGQEHARFFPTADDCPIDSRV